MTDELQADPIADTATPTEGSDLATDTGENQEPKITFTDEQQKVFDDAIGKKTFKQRQQQREFQESDVKKDARIAELEGQIPKDMRPVVPPVPDSYDEDFSEKLQARDEAIRATAAYDAREELTLKQQQQAAVQAQNDEIATANKEIATYTQNATNLGIKPEELQKSGDMLGQMGITQDLARQLLSEETGPLMTNYLAANPDVFDQLNRADQWSAGVILNDVRLKAAELKPQTTTAPAPADTLHGGGSTSKERGPKNAKYY